MRTRKNTTAKAATETTREATREERLQAAIAAINTAIWVLPVGHASEKALEKVAARLCREQARLEVLSRERARIEAKLNAITAEQSGLANT